MQLSGQMDGRNVHHQTVASRQRPAIHAGGIIGVVGAAIVVGVLSAGQHSWDARLRACLEEAIADVCLFIDGQLGRKESRASQRFQFLQWMRWAGGLGVGILIVVIGATFGHRPIQWKMLVVLWLLPSAAMFYCVHALSFAVMPSSFLLHEPRGQKAMARSGCRSTTSMRIVAVSLSIILLFITIVFSIAGVLVQFGK